MSVLTLDNPQAIVERLDAIERDLAVRQNDLETAALDWFKAKRDKERRHAEVFMATEGTVAERSAVATLATAEIGADAEARWEALKAVVRVLDTRASVGQSLLRTQSR